jgi:hypothetical protein
VVSHGAGYFDPRVAQANDFSLLSASAGNDSGSSDAANLSQSEAMRELIVRYLDGFGPATFRDFLKWSGIKISSAKPVWNDLASDLVALDAGNGSGSGTDKTLYSTTPITAATRAQALAQCADSVAIGARFDASMTGYVDKSWLVPSERVRTMWSSNGILMAPLVAHGKMIGHWTYKLAGTSGTPGARMSVEVHHWEKIARATRTALSAQFEQVARFLEAELTGITYTAL